MHDLLGISLCLSALLIQVWGSYSFYPLQFHLFSLPIFVAGIVLLVFGVDSVRMLIFPILLLIFLCPFPLLFLDMYGVNLIDSVATLSAGILKVFLPIQLSFRPIVVMSTVTSAGQSVSFELAAACSGIYSLTAIVFLTVILLYLSYGSLAKKTVFVGFAIFTAYGLNVLRIVLTVFLGHFFGYGLAVDFFHLFGGVVLLFLGGLLLAFTSDKLLKLSFSRPTSDSDCPHCSARDRVCYSCGRVFKLPRISFEWKRLALFFLFLLIVATVIFQASAISYNKVGTSEDQSLNFNSSSGQLETFSNLSDWSFQFLGREPEAENRLGLAFVGDYALFKSGNLTGIEAILEFSDAQSKFHTWEGCLSYQSVEINIQKTSYSTIYDKNNVIVNAETIIANIPAYKQDLVVMYWFDSVNLKENGTASTNAVKVSLLSYVAKPDNGSNAENVQAAVSELSNMGTEIENAWSSYKTIPTSFVVDLYRNMTPSAEFVAGLLLFSAAMMLTQTLLIRFRASKKTAELPAKDRELLKSLNSKTPISAGEVCDTTNNTQQESSMVKKIEELKQVGLLQERIILKNGQLYVKWRSPVN